MSVGRRGRVQAPCLQPSQPPAEQGGPANPNTRGGGGGPHGKNFMSERARGQHSKSIPPTRTLPLSSLSHSLSPSRISSRLSFRSSRLTETDCNYVQHTSHEPCVPPIFLYCRCKTPQEKDCSNSFWVASLPHIPLLNESPFATFWHTPYP